MILSTPSQRFSPFWSAHSLQGGAPKKGLAITCVLALFLLNFGVLFGQAQPRRGNHSKLEHPSRAPPREEVRSLATLPDCEGRKAVSRYPCMCGRAPPPSETPPSETLLQGELARLGLRLFMGVLCEGDHGPRRSVGRVPGVVSIQWAGWWPLELIRAVAQAMHGDWLVAQNEIPRIVSPSEREERPFDVGGGLSSGPMLGRSCTTRHTQLLWAPQHR